MMYDPDLSAIIREAFTHLNADAQAAGPFLGERIASWIQNVYKTERPEEAFMNPDAFPLFLLPWYAESSLKPQADNVFQSDLIYSTINGYYYIRFIDNLVDGHKQTLNDLPILNFFSTNFQIPYQKYFTHDHPFWGYFRSTWFHSAEVSILDAHYSDIDMDEFIDVSAQKTCAVRIPVAAVFFLYESPTWIEKWERFISLFGCWHQMFDDIRDFPRDEADGNLTYFLSEANRRKNTDENVIDWVIREGHNWGMLLLDGWMEEMQDLVSQLNSPDLNKYIQERKLTLMVQKANADRSLEQIRDILVSLKNRRMDHLGG